MQQGKKKITLASVIESIRPSPPTTLLLHATRSIEAGIGGKGDHDNSHVDRRVTETENSQKNEARSLQQTDPNITVSDNNMNGQLGGSPHVENQECHGDGGSVSDLKMSMSEETNVISNIVGKTAPSVEDKTQASNKTTSTTEESNLVGDQNLGEASYAPMSTRKSEDMANAVQNEDETSCTSYCTDKPNDELNLVDETPLSTGEIHIETNLAEDQEEDSYKSNSTEKHRKVEGERDENEIK